MKETDRDHHGVNTGSSGVGWCSLVILPGDLHLSYLPHPSSCLTLLGRQVCSVQDLGPGLWYQQNIHKNKMILYWVQNKPVVQQPNPIVLLTVIDLLYICTDMTKRGCWLSISAKNK